MEWYLDLARATPQQRLPQERSSPEPSDEPAGKAEEDAKGWVRALRGCLRLPHVRAPRAVHSFEAEASVARLGTTEAQEREDPEAAEGAVTPGEFGSLPEHLLDGILTHLRGCSRLTHYNVCAVSRSWRQLGRQLYFSTPWMEPRLICHPAQLFCLSPRPVETNRSGLLKCFVRRDIRPGCSSGTRRYLVYLGRDHKQMRKTRFLMCAVQASRCEVLVYLNKEGRGTPVGRLSANGFCTRYSMGFAPGVQLLGAGGAGGAAAAVATQRQGKGQGPGLQPQPQQPPRAAPDQLGSLQYRARLRGFMQPRRVDVELPPLCKLAFGWGLPALCHKPSSSSSDAPQQGAGSPPSAAPEAPSAAAGSSAAGVAAAVPPSGPPAPSPQPQLYRSQRHASALQALLLQQQAAAAAVQQAAGAAGPPPGLSLRNKPPQWNPELRCWCLNFRGRVKQASVKNFQLICEGDPSERVVLQFGKVERDTYIMDFNPTVISAFQAFSVALSTFDNKFLL